MSGKESLTTEAQTKLNSVHQRYYKQIIYIYK